MKHKLDTQTLDILKRSRIDGAQLHLPEQLDRAAYTKVKKAIEMLGGKWERHEGAHVFPDDAGDIVTEAVMTGEIVDRKKLFQFFPTPTAIADRMVKLACIKPGDIILEPSAGHGSLIKAIRRAGHKNYIGYCELDPKNQDVLFENRPDEDVECQQSDFMSMGDEPEYDVIIANPPFRAGQDVKHVIKMLGLLKKGGRLVAITSPGWTFRTDALHKGFASTVEELGMDYKELEEGTFAESGTPIRTVLINYTKQL